MLLILLAAPAQAFPATTIEFRQASFNGQQNLEAQASALQIRSTQQLDVASIAAEARHIQVITTNLTGPVVAQIGANPNRDGATRSFENARLHAASSFTDVDLFVSPKPSSPLPQMVSTGAGLSIGVPAQNRVRETAYVDSSRPVASQDVSQLLGVETRGSSLLRLEGSFIVSFWSWNFTVAASSQESDFVTGAYRSNVVSDPITGSAVAWNEFVQVAQVEITDGWLEIRNAHAATQTAYTGIAEIVGTGVATVDGATGLLAGIEARNSRIDADGQYDWTARRGAALSLDVERFYGDASIDGEVLDLGDTGPIRSSTVARNEASPAWAYGLGILALMLVALLVKGPAMTAGFNRLQSRFDAKDYTGVLDRIEPYTRRRKFSRRATFLKAISLLSLQEYKEAHLYLQTLGPRESPEPATKAFLNACASAGLGQDNATIKHLSECFQADPSYIEEARTVPVLAGYLPYFSIATAEEAAT